MKVKELIAHLQKEDPELPVFVLGYERGLDDLLAVIPVNVALDVNTAWYYGTHEQLLDKDEQEEYASYKQTKGILL